MLFTEIGAESCRRVGVSVDRVGLEWVAGKKFKIIHEHLASLHHCFSMMCWVCFGWRDGWLGMRAEVGGWGETWSLLKFHKERSERHEKEIYREITMLTTESFEQNFYDLEMLLRKFKENFLTSFLMLLFPHFFSTLHPLHHQNLQNKKKNFFIS